MRSLALLLAGSLSILVLVAGCGSGQAPLPPGCTPMKELIAAKRAPIEIFSTRMVPNPMMKQFRLALRNVSDKPVKAVEWTSFYFGKDGKLLPGGQKLGTCSQPLGMKPGETWEAATAVPDEVSKAKVVLKTVVYESLPPGAEGNESMKHYLMSFRWTNPDHDVQVVAEGGKVEPRPARARPSPTARPPR